MGGSAIAGSNWIGSFDEPTIYSRALSAAEVLGRTPAGPVIRLRDHPEEATASGTIYRYDREGLVAALSDARHRQIAGTLGR